MAPVREAKPTWDAVPARVRQEAEAIVGGQVVRATRAFGGYGPSATFLLSLNDGRRAFFKGIYPLPEESAVRWALDEEERVYDELAELIDPWAPAYFGSLRSEGWHAMLIEAVPGRRVPPWTTASAKSAVTSYAEFHAKTAKRDLPSWLSREFHLEFAGYWSTFATDERSRAQVAALCPTPSLVREATEWIAANGPRLDAAEEPLSRAERVALLHFDTRSDNIRIDGNLLRIFDWPWACVGPPEFDFGAFAQSIASEGGPDAEQLSTWYSAVLPLDDALLTASVAGISGFFADRGSRPDMPGLPRLRSHQRRQLKSSLDWAARRLALPTPKWLESVAD